MTALSLDGRCALVTGASRGIGRAIAHALDEAGARVALTGRDEAALANVAQGLVHPPVVIVADLVEPGAPQRVAQAALAEFGTLDILVNNAASTMRLSTVDTTPEVIDAMLAVNVRAPLLLIACVVPAMSAQKRGAIINLSSVSALVGTPRRAAYAASKGALDAATRSLAVELGPAGIRVNAVAPGVVDTDLWAKNKAIPGVVSTIEQQTPLRRWAHAGDIAPVVAFLASDAARFVTGETIAVDGGMARTLDLYGGSV